MNLVKKGSVKKWVVRSLIVIGTVVFVLAGLFVFRQPVATFTLERLLADTTVTLEQLDGLDIGWSQIQIKQLALRTDSFQQPIRIRGLKVGFSAFDGKLKDIAIDRLFIPAYQQKQTSPEETSPLPGLGESIRQLHELPVQSLRIHQVSGLPQGELEDVHWQHKPGQQLLHLEYKDLLLALDLTTTVEPSVQMLVEAKLRREKQDVLALQIALTQQEDNYLGKLVLESSFQNWAAELALLQQQIPSLAAISDVHGQLNLLLQTELTDNLDQLFQQALSVTVIPDMDSTAQYADAALPKSPLQMALKLDQPIALNIKNQEAANLSLASLKISLSDMNDQLTANLDLSAINCQWQSTLTCNMALSAALQATALSVQDVQVQSVEANTRGTLMVTDQQVVAVLNAGQLLRMEKLQQEEITLQELALNSPKPIQITLDRSSNEIALIADTLLAKVKDAQLPQAELSTELVFNKLRLKQTDQLALQTAVSAMPINVRIPEQPLPDFGFVGDLSLQDETLAISGSLSSDLAKPLVEVKGEHRIDEQDGNLRLRSATVPFDQAANSLSKHFSNWPWKFDIVSGQWLMNSTLAWQQQGDEFAVSGQFSQTLEQLAGNYQDIAFSGLQSTLDTQIKSIDSLVSAAPATLTIKAMDMGLPVSDIQVRASFDSSAPQLHLHQFDARLLGGTVSAEDIVYRPGEQETPAPVTIANIDLGELVRLTSSKEISVTGKLSGELPLVIGPDGPYMAKGLLGALEPGGVLKYQPDAATQQAIAENPATQFAYQVLGNYHYSTLDAEVSYQPDGQLVLSNRMYGINPDLNNGQPIKLNPKIEINVLDTLKSLRIGRAVEDFFEQQLENP
ncbi:YdbH domain-containing protein [bacterium SCSIO 12696]|nr:YdbH domain-containing protein [bacterium SCSIO 12696]